MRPTLTALIVVIVTTLVLIECLNFTGFCYPKLRYFSDAELIESAIKDRLLQQSPDSVTGRTKMYASIQEFYEQNYNCCAIDHWSSSPGFSASPVLRLIGVYNALVSIDYRINEAGGWDNFYGSTSAVDACATVLKRRGMPMADYPHRK